MPVNRLLLLAWVAFADLPVRAGLGTTLRWGFGTADYSRMLFKQLCKWGDCYHGTFLKIPVTLTIAIRCPVSFSYFFFIFQIGMYMNFTHFCQKSAQ